MSVSLASLRSWAPAIGLLLATSACNQLDAKPQNVLIVSIDTLRADHVGAYGAAGTRTPTLDRLAEEGVRFDAAFSPAPLTLPSHSTMMTGTDPHRHGVRHNGIHRLSNEATTLAERFSAAGFSTGAVVGSRVIAAHSGLDQGFAHYDDAIEQTGDHASAQRRAESVTAAALRWLDETAEPFFLFVHYYDPHRPYDPPIPYSGAAPTAYDGEIHYTDAMLGKLLDGLDADGDLDRTLILVTSDHGEGLGQHDELTHGHAIHDATQRVPLLVRGPGVPRGRTVAEIARTADIAPTLLAALQLPPLTAIDGIDLAPLWRPESTPKRVAYVESLATRYDHGWSPLHGLRTDEYLYLASPHPQLYEVASDPGQRKNLLEEGGNASIVRATAFEQQLSELLANDKIAREQTLDPATLAELRALGYALPEVAIEENGLDPRIGRKSLTLFHEGDTLYQAGRPEEAAARFEEMLAISPESGEGWISLGAARLDAGDLEAAHLATRTGAEKMPERGSAWLQLGVIDMALDRPAQAETSFRRTTELNPEAPGGHMRLLKALMVQRKLDVARAYAARVAALEWADEIWLRRIADFWEAEEEPGLALAGYRRVLERAPDSERDHMHAAIALIRMGRANEANEELRLSGAVAEQPRAQKALVAAYLDAGRKEDARRFLESIPPDAPTRQWATAQLHALWRNDG